MTRPYNDLLATEGEKSQRFIWSGELLMSEGEAAFSYLNDHLGSPIRLMGSEQEEVLAYDEFGIPTIEPGADTTLHNPFGFTGYQRDEVSGLYYAQARYYDPVSSRMVSEDTHWNPQNIFTIGCFFVTQKFVDFCNSNQFTNFVFTPTDKYRI